MKTRLQRYVFKGIIALGLTALSHVATAQEQGGDLAQANNPLADITAFNIQNYYIDQFTGLPDDVDGNQFVLRYAKPIHIGDSDWLIRASLPVNSFPVGDGGDTVSGVGDFDIFAAYQFNTGKAGVSFAIGPQVVAPTATDDRLGSEQWQLGLANVYFNAASPVFQYGYLLTWRGGVGDTHDRDRVSLGALQPFAFYQLGNGWYTGGAPVWTYNFSNDNYNVPLGLRIGKVIKHKDTVFNFFVEPQRSVFSEGDGQPERQIYFALNMQFL